MAGQTKQILEWIPPNRREKLRKHLKYDVNVFPGKERFRIRWTASAERRMQKIASVVRNRARAYSHTNTYYIYILNSKFF